MEYTCNECNITSTLPDSFLPKQDTERVERNKKVKQELEDWQTKWNTMREMHEKYADEYVKYRKGQFFWSRTKYRDFSDYLFKKYNLIYEDTGYGRWDLLRFPQRTYYIECPLCRTRHYVDYNTDLN